MTSLCHRSFCPIAAAVILLVLLFTPDADTQTVAADLSPGIVGLIAVDDVTAANQALLFQALMSERAPVRAAAARVAFTQGRRGLHGPIVAALAKETDGDAALEQARFVIVFGSADDDSVLIDAAPRLSWADGREVALLVARARGLSALQYLSRLRTVHLDTSSHAQFLRVATRGEQAPLAALVASALRDGDTDLLAAVLAAARLGDVVSLGDDVLRALLETRNTVRVRAMALAHLLLTSAPGSSPSGGLRAAFEAALQAGTIDSPGTELIIELARRVVGATPRTDPQWTSLLTTHAEALRKELSELRAFQLTKRLAPPEYAALTKSIYGEPLQLSAAVQPTTGAGNAAVGPSIRLLSGYPRGFIASVMATARCDVGRQSAAGTGGSGGRVFLRPDGRPARVSLMDPPSSRECARAVEALLRTYAAEPGRLLGADAQDILVFPFQPDFVDCQDTMTRSAPESPTVEGARVKAPTQTRRVSPEYPRGAQADRVSGVVIVQTIISPTGCVAAATVTKGIDIRLDWAALRAITRWTYTPTLLDGTPTPIIMNVAVTFRLN